VKESTFDRDYRNDTVSVNEARASIEKVMSPLKQLCATWHDLLPEN